MIKELRLRECPGISERTAKKRIELIELLVKLRKAQDGVTVEVSEDKLQKAVTRQ